MLFLSGIKSSQITVVLSAVRLSILPGSSARYVKIFLHHTFTQATDAYQEENQNEFHDLQSEGSGFCQTFFSPVPA